MKLLDYFRFGLKNIWRQKARTILTIFAIMIGATSVVAMLTIVVTAKALIVGQIQSAGALTLISISSNTDMRSDDPFNTYGGSDTGVKLLDETVTEIKQIPHVKSAEPILGAWQLRTANIAGSEKKVTFDQISGINPVPQNEKEMAAGRNFTSADTKSVIIGGRYLESLGYKGDPSGIIGKTLVFQVKGYTGEGAEPPKPTMSADGKMGGNDKDSQEKVVTLEGKVVGVMASSLYDNQVFVPMSWARQLQVNKRWEFKQAANQNQNQNQKQGPSQPSGEFVLVSEDNFPRMGYSAIQAYADDTTQVAGIAEKVKEKKLGAATAQEMIDQIQKMLNLLGLALGAVGAISLSVAAIGVINTMVMATLERTREIGVLRACGATRSTIRRLFTFEASMLGFWGGVFGVGVAYAVVMLARIFGTSILAEQGLQASLIQIPIWLALATIGVTTVIGTLAGLLPAIRASRMNPVEALRYE